MSISSADRNNSNKTIGSVAPIERKQIGYKYDFLISDTASEHEESQEYGAGKVSIKYQKKKGTKMLREGSVELPKLLKDMLDRLILKKKDFSKLRSFEVVHSGLTMQFITADRPSRYITRITRGKELTIATNVDKFGSEVLPAVVLIWQLKQQILNIRSIVISSKNNGEQKNSQWLKTCLENNDNFIIPTTSNSTEYV